MGTRERDRCARRKWGGAQHGERGGGVRENEAGTGDLRADNDSTGFGLTRPVVWLDAHVRAHTTARDTDVAKIARSRNLLHSGPRLPRRAGDVHAQRVLVDGDNPPRRLGYSASFQLQFDGHHRAID